MDFCRLLTLCLALITISSTSAQTIKCATVDLNTLLLEYHISKRVISDLEVQKAKHQSARSELNHTFTELEGQIKTLVPKLKSKNLTPSGRASLTEKYQILLRRYKSLDLKLNEPEQGEIVQIKAQIAVATRTFIDEINLVVAQYARENKYHWIIETSGVSNTQTSPLIYARDTTDITAAILAIINRDAPEEVTSP